MCVARCPAVVVTRGLGDLAEEVCQVLPGVLVELVERDATYLDRRGGPGVPHPFTTQLSGQHREQPLVRIWEDSAAGHPPPVPLLAEVLRKVRSEIRVAWLQFTASGSRLGAAAVFFNDDKNTKNQNV